MGVLDWRIQWEVDGACLSALFVGVPSEGNWGCENRFVCAGGRSSDWVCCDG